MLQRSELIGSRERGSRERGSRERGGTVLGGMARASYGDQLIARLGEQLAQAFPDVEKVASLMRLLSWTHFLQLLPLKTAEARHYYAQQAITERWSVRELRRHIERKAFERTALAGSQGERAALALANPEPDAASAAALLAAAPGLVFKDPYFLDFLGLRQGHDEADLETAILRQLEAFILELGRGFAFVERQKRMVIDGAKSPKFPVEIILKSKP